eukprot:CAMPEP_0184696602 /NCGR_PEP_ID=MMETSP0313-20130426/3841_1 /TAXON_ID=2792 /ORGANISM="Porphyridium aerugineum, Strain SAG 1380-2" /LENGTH=68 /DNA_ID=CAMNT_0027155255 /DNA_START=64 /DNA_END=270 /DNA_ORIENTATION=+
MVKLDIVDDAWMKAKLPNDDLILKNPHPIHIASIAISSSQGGSSTIVPDVKAGWDELNLSDLLKLQQS